MERRTKERTEGRVDGQTKLMFCQCFSTAFHRFSNASVEWTHRHDNIKPYRLESSKYNPAWVMKTEKESTLKS